MILSAIHTIIENAFIIIIYYIIFNCIIIYWFQILIIVIVLYIYIHIFFVHCLPSNPSTGFLLPGPLSKAREVSSNETFRSRQRGSFMAVMDPWNPPMRIKTPVARLITVVCSFAKKTFVNIEWWWKIPDDGYWNDGYSMCFLVHIPTSVMGIPPTDSNPFDFAFWNMCLRFRFRRRAAPICLGLICFLDMSIEHGPGLGMGAGLYVAGTLWCRQPEHRSGIKFGRQAFFRRFDVWWKRL